MIYQKVLNYFVNKNPEYKDIDYFKFFINFDPENPENKERLFHLNLIQ